MLGSEEKPWRYDKIELCSQSLKSRTKISSLLFLHSKERLWKIMLAARRENNCRDLYKAYQIICGFYLLRWVTSGWSGQQHPASATWLARAQVQMCAIVILQPPYVTLQTNFYMTAKATKKNISLVLILRRSRRTSVSLRTALFT